MKLKFLISLFLLPILLSAQTVITSVPQYPNQTDNIVFTFDVKNATHANKIAGYTGRVYAHTGVTLQTGTSAAQRWQKVIGNWGDNAAQPELTRLSTDIYQITINNPRSYYKVTDASQKVTEICMVLRSADGTKQSEDLFIKLYESGLTFVYTNPIVTNSYGDPLRSPAFVEPDSSLLISVTTVGIGKKTNWLQLYVDGVMKYQIAQSTLEYKLPAADIIAGKHDIKLISIDESLGKDSSSFVLFKNPRTKNIPLPTDCKFGINYQSNPTEVILALYGPQKKFVYAIGEFNDWKVDTTYFLNKYEVTPDSVIWWTKLTNLSPSKEYGFQYLVDGQIRIADPYTDKILDPSNDSYITSTTYPNLKAYPSGVTDQIVSVFQTGQTSYTWKIPNFVRPSKEKLIIYELLVRDFTVSHSYKAIKDSINYFKNLGINAIELMPINEFEGNSSWGYNPSFYLAPDKYYGTKNDLKALIDECHANGIAVIMDIVLNHAYGSNPMVRMYWNNSTGKPAANNPWFNQQSNFANPDAQWGYDFNHESKATQYFVDYTLKYWLTEYKFDGFRFDFTKGFGNNYKSLSDSWGSNYDADRIRLLKRMVNKAWSYDPTAFMIFEHLAVNSEEKELSDAGILLWGNMNYNYNEATMGYNDSGKSNFESVSYKSRGWTQPNLVGYMESHDEERLMYKNLTYGNSNGTYNIKNLEVALQRMKLAGAFFFTVPGPKMIWQFGDLGYDYSIDYNGRLGTKPIRWDYLNVLSRNRLYKTWNALMKLKTDYPAFSSSEFRMSVSGYLKRLWIDHSSMNISIVGNFGVAQDTLIPQFQNTGKWYNYFTGEEVDITDVNMKVILEAGEFKIFTSVKLPTPEQGILSEIENDNKIPDEYSLSQNFPNPFNPETTINYKVSSTSHVRLTVYDILGRLVATLVDEVKQPGNYSSTFSINNFKLSSGVYFYRFSSGSFVETKKMVLMK